MSMMKVVSAGLLSVSAFLAGCTNESSGGDVTPLPSETELEAQQSLTVGSLTMTALQPELSYSDVRGRVTITGSGSAKMGACLLSLVHVTSSHGGTGAQQACNSNSDCATFASGFTNGAAYCAATNNSGTKYCYVRPGSQANFCAGSPALGGVAIGAGTYSTPWTWVTNGIPGYETYDAYWDGWDDNVTYIGWITYGCFNGCGGSTTTPSVSTGLGYEQGNSYTYTSSY